MILAKKLDIAIDRLFEFHKVAIAKDHARRLKPQEKKYVINIFKVKYQGIKIRFLLRYFGYVHCQKFLDDLATDPEKIFPTWPIGTGDRRNGFDRRKKSNPDGESPNLERRKLVLGRRFTDDPTVQLYVSDELEAQDIPPGKDDRPISYVN